MKHARRMLVCQIGRGSAPPDLLIDDCEVVWTASTGLISVLNATPTAGGSGYTAGDILDVTTGGVGGKVRVSTVDGGGAVTAIALYMGGYGGYTTGTGKATSGGTGTGCTVNITTVGNPSVTLNASTVHDGTSSVRVSTSTSSSIRSLIAYRAISPGSLAAYSRMKAWVQNSAATYDGDEFRLCLCSDAVGRVVVDEFVVPAIAGEDAWVEVDMTKTGGGTLLTNAGSIALYRLGGASPSGFFYLDNIRVSA